MKSLAAVAVLVFVGMSAYAQGPKPCEELKSEIAKRLDDKGVVNYTLTIVAKDQEVTEGKVVGTCEGGTKKIIYLRTTQPPKTPPPPKTAK